MYIRPIYSLAAVLTGWVDHAEVVRDVPLLVPSSIPPYAEKLDPQLVAFSIEADRWPEWAGHKVGEPNRYAQQLFANLQERSGRPPAIRVGADSEDRTHVDLSLRVGHAVYPPSTPAFPYPKARTISLGRDWYALSSNFAYDTPFTWGLNLKSLDKNETVRQAKLLSAAFEKGNLEAVEIGNEPELYLRKVSGGGVENPGDWSEWGVMNYTQTWSDYAKAVAQEVTLGKTVLRLGDISLAGAPTGWTPQTIFQAGLFDDEFHVNHTKILSEHLYSANFVPGHEAPLGSLMDKASIRGNLSVRAADIRAARKQGMSFVLAAALGEGPRNRADNSHGSPGTSDTAEAALWAIDYVMYAATLGVSRVYLSHGVGYRYSSFQPVSGIWDDGRGLDRPHILPLYYGLLTVNEAIGTGSDLRIVELSIEHPNVASYGIYDGGKLARVVLINTQVRKRGQNPHRVTVKLDGVSGSFKTLFIPHTSTQGGLTWGGQDFDRADGKAHGSLVKEVISEGIVLLEASSAALIFVE